MGNVIDPSKLVNRPAGALYQSVSGGSTGGGGAASYGYDRPAPGIDPSAYVIDKSKISGGATAGGSAANATELAYYDDQANTLNGLLGSTNKTLENGLTSLSDSFAKETDRANANQNNALAKYDTQTQDTTKGKQSALNATSSQSRNLSESVRRALGQASGTNSSAFQLVAPNLIAKDATTKRQGVLDTFGKNLRDIDTAKTDTTNSFKSYLDDLASQRKEKESSLREGVLTQQQNLQNSLGQIARDKAAAGGAGYSAQRAASAPYQGQAAATQSALDNLFSQFRTPYQTKDVSVATPSLSAYTVDPTNVQQNTTTATGESPYQSFLRKKFADTTA